eukprot:TRINITY_DN9350_c0_g2_i2.p1 TRINITY_DN9350_c0_g2~~TRINITY_DN9350_c0_g2_i2.p1  ORF type:complete len:158 (-),score=19.89 TRINITY_DN9350_c0_g2_i2:145-618(-)
MMPTLLSLPGLYLEKPPNATLNDEAVVSTQSTGDERRLFEGAALIRRLHRLGVLDESKAQLDFVLQLKIEDFLERRLQTQVMKKGLAKSPHHARVLIRQRHIRVRNQLVTIPSYLVRVDSQKHIEFALTSPFGTGRPGRVKRKKNAQSAKKAEEETE